MTIELVANEQDLTAEGYAVATVFVTHKDDGNIEVRIFNVSYDTEERKGRHFRPAQVSDG